MLQRSSRTGVIGPADKKLAIREKKSALRIVREKLFEQRIAKHKINRCKTLENLKRMKLKKIMNMKISLKKTKM